MPDHAPTRTVLLVVFGALLVLLVLTAVVSELPLGAFAMPVAIGIAGAKAALIFLYFMHLRYQRSGLIRVVAISGLFWGAIAAVLTFSDYLTRGWMP